VKSRITQPFIVFHTPFQKSYGMSKTPIHESDFLNQLVSLTYVQLSNLKNGDLVNDKLKARVGDLLGAVCEDANLVAARA